MEFQKKWYFPDAYMPDTGDGISHETISVLNLSGEEAQISLTLYFENSRPMKGFYAQCCSERTCHIRLDRLKTESGASIPRCVPYSIEVESSVPVLCQYTRVDATRPSYSLMTALY